MSWLLACVFSLLISGASEARADALHADSRFEKTLLIRDLSVVEDARAKGTGPWGLGGVMQELAPQGKPAGVSEFFRRWMNLWGEVTEVNGFPVTPRRVERYLSLWPKELRSRLDMSEAPYRLLAIVYRPDIANKEAPFGEVRLVYCGVRPDDRAGVEFLVIFEFKIPSDPGSWARAFHRLEDLSFGPEYNAELESLTRHLFVRDNFLRLRTNDFFGADVWEFRQFELGHEGWLIQRPLTDTPDLSYQEDERRSQRLIELIRAQEREILEGRFHLPADTLAGSSLAKEDSFRWLYSRREELSEEARRLFSEGTCNGCHTGETRTVFSHIWPRAEKHASRISRFLEAQLVVRARKMIELLAHP